MSALHIIKSGPQSTLQDIGRRGFQRIGLTQGGAMDPQAYLLGQRLVGNPDGLPAIETTLGGLEFKTTAPVSIAVTGAHTPVFVNGEEHPRGQTITLASGDHVRLAQPRSGNYSYVSMTGGLAIPKTLNSYTTVLRCGLGGLSGRALVDGDELPLTSHKTTQSALSLPEHRYPSTDQTLVLRVVNGFQSDRLPSQVLQAFFNQTYSVSTRAGRVAVQLLGAPIDTGISQLYSEGTCLGAIQVPPDGQPFVLLNDRPTLGGYPKIGAVIESDCARLAQAAPGTKVRLAQISIEEAKRIRWLNNNYLQELVPHEF